jgi:uncharacterized protein YcfJ
MTRFSLSPALIAAVSVATMSTVSQAHAAEGRWHNGSWYANGDQPQNSSAERMTQSAPMPVRSDDRPRYDGPTQPLAMPGRDAWLVDCRSRTEARDNGVGGAVIGGVVGGVAGNRIAGRHNRVVGTLGGAAVGAVTGAAIDRAEDRGRARDECEAYLDDYYARYAEQYAQPGVSGYRAGYAQPGYMAGYAPGYAYGGNNGCCASAPVMMVPVQTQPECTETIEYIYEDVPVRQHSYRPVKRQKIVTDKRVRIINDKRVSSK